MIPDGLVLLNKPAGMTSARLVSRVKRITGARRAGHTGTLDPSATGLMIICLNRATRLAQFFLKGEKGYLGTLVLGAETDTQDAEGRVTATHPVPALTALKVRQVFDAFVGPIDQVPPVHSALKHHGVPLYRLARQGRPVQKAARRVEIRRLQLVKLDPPDIGFEVTCSAGTYVRTLCADIGRQLGCGAYLKALQRTHSSGFDLSQAVSLEALAERAREGGLEQLVMPLSRALPDVPMIQADKVLTEKIKYGRMIALADLRPLQTQGPSGLRKIVDAQGRLLALVELNPCRSHLAYRGVFIN